MVAAAVADGSGSERPQSVTATRQHLRCLHRAEHLEQGLFQKEKAPAFQAIVRAIRAILHRSIGLHDLIRTRLRLPDLELYYRCPTMLPARTRRRLRGRRYARHWLLEMTVSPQQLPPLLYYAGYHTLNIYFRTDHPWARVGDEAELTELMRGKLQVIYGLQGEENQFQLIAGPP